MNKPSLWRLLGCICAILTITAVLWWRSRPHHDLSVSLLERELASLKPVGQLNCACGRTPEDNIPTARVFLKQTYEEVNGRVGTIISSDRGWETQIYDTDLVTYRSPDYEVKVIGSWLQYGDFGHNEACGLLKSDSHLRKQSQNPCALVVIHYLQKEKAVRH